ncbi:MAG: AAA family ATPase [Devosia sp.]|uniref:PriCT-2 domain-containing protein n=1 Tax=Devosia sp. TaxID=1871048 RepID=UPI0019F85081|nr:AAA family ATPase [Devosia sp.]MBF0678555.1 AAA family ATPase [Devosia sp.]
MAKLSAFECMVSARRWLIASPNKVPHYVDGSKRSGALDCPEDHARLATYADAQAALASRPGWLLGFALGPTESGYCWQGVDLDKIRLNGTAHFANEVAGYVEKSVSGEGAHAIGYGRRFAPLGSNGSGIEAYSTGRYFVVTENGIRPDAELVDLADYVEQVLTPRHAAGRAGSSTKTSNAGAGLVTVDAKTVTELRSALLSMRSDDRDLWMRMGHALKELGDVGRGLWLDWSATSDEHQPKKDARQWDGFKPDRTGYQAVFKAAQEGGWVNPMSKAAQLASTSLKPSSPPLITLEFAMASDTATIKVDYLLDPYLPAKCVVGFFGRGSTAKSSFLASMAAGISGTASTLWVSVEEPADWIKVRHIKCGAQEGTLAIVKAVASEMDHQGRVIASSFNAYEHLEVAIEQAKGAFTGANKPPLRLVVLDTAVGLTAWGKGESPNDDAAVKKLLGYLQALAEQHDLTIAFIGHSNKGKHEYFADTVMGASAWTNSPRLSFVHAADRREDYAYVMRVAKTNFDPFGVPYRTTPVHTLYERQNGPDTVLVRVEPEEIVWGNAESLEMFEKATKKPDDDGGGSSWAGAPRKTVVDIVRDKLVEMVHSGQDRFITREQVELQLPDQKVNRAQWTKVDSELRQLPQIFQVDVTLHPGGGNKTIYRALAVPVPQ